MSSCVRRCVIRKSDDNLPPASDAAAIKTQYPISKKVGDISKSFTHKNRVYAKRTLLHCLCISVARFDPRASLKCQGCERIRQRDRDWRDENALIIRNNSYEHSGSPRPGIPGRGAGGEGQGGATINPCFTVFCAWSAPSSPALLPRRAGGEGSQSCRSSLLRQKLPEFAICFRFHRARPRSSVDSVKNGLDLPPSWHYI